MQEAEATVRDEFLSRHAVLHSGLFDDCQLHSCVKNRAALALLLSLAEQTVTLRQALELIDAVLTTVEGDHVPLGHSPKLHARGLARAALTAVTATETGS